MTFCLNSVIIRPENGSEIKNAIILLHGYGGDGKDICQIQFLFAQMGTSHVL